MEIKTDEEIKEVFENKTPKSTGATRAAERLRQKLSDNAIYYAATPTPLPSRQRVRWSHRKTEKLIQATAKKIVLRNRRKLAKNKE